MNQPTNQEVLTSHSRSGAARNWRLLLVGLLALMSFFPALLVGWRLWVEGWSSSETASSAVEKGGDWYLFGSCLALSFAALSLAFLYLRSHLRADWAMERLLEVQDLRLKSEERFRMLAEHAGEVIFFVGLHPQPRLQYISPAIKRVAGYQPDEILNDASLLHDLIQPEAWLTLFKNVKEAGQPIPLQRINLKHRAGHNLVVEAQISPWPGGGSVPDVLVGIARDVTDRSQAEDALRESEERVTRIVETIADGLLILDTKGQIKFANLAAAQILEVPEHSADAPAWQRMAESTGLADALVSLGGLLLQGRARHSFLYSLRLPSERSLKLAISVAVLRNRASEPLGLVASLRDVTVEKQTEQDLVDSQTRLTLCNGILQTMAGNPAFATVLSYAIDRLAEHFQGYRVVCAKIQPDGTWEAQRIAASSQAVYGSGALGTLGLGDIPFFAEHLNEGQTVQSSDLACDPRFTPVQFSLAHARVRALVEVAIGSSAQEILTLAFHSAEPREWTPHEVTTLREVARYLATALRSSEAEQNRRLAETRLAAEKEQLTITLRSIADGVVTTDVHGRVVLMNGVAETITGLTQSEAAGKDLSEAFNARHEKTGDSIPQSLGRLLRDGLPLPNHTAILEAASGSQHILSESAAAIIDSRGSVTGLVLVFRDITDRRRIDEELIKATKLESVGLLAGGIAHDFNNIITIVLGNVSLSKMLAGPGTQVAERLAQAEVGCLRARDLTRQLLTFAKGGAPVKKLTSLAELIEETVRFALRGSNVLLGLNIAPGLWNAEVDEGQISQVINNLTINAVQAMPAGGELRVSVSNATLNESSGIPLNDGNYIRMELRDEGIGIRPQDLTHIFEPYFTTKKTGTGLGLATTYAIVQKHNGHITVESKPGVGTVFRIYLPASRQSAPERLVENRVVPRGRGRILVMDDEVSILDLTRDSLGIFGYQVDTARDGAEAVRLFREAKLSGRPFELVIMDLTVPGGLGGKEALRELQRIDPSVCAVVSSGYSHDPVLANFGDFGFSGVVVKPYRIDALGQVVSQVIAEHQERLSRPHQESSPSGQAFRGQIPE